MLEGLVNLLFLMIPVMVVLMVLVTAEKLVSFVCYLVKKAKKKRLAR